ELSMNAACIPRVKRVIRQISRQESVEVLDQLLKLPTAQEVNRYVEEDMAQRFPNIFGPPTI
ncbi:MAG: hypothetical protein AB7F20_04185, partial [Geoalkalibacter sp.]|uniref:hypothetical protein n=1 Tax=Geoalkalibacter sp. TaxID=3041440 RepID=UPI003D0D2B2A